MNKTSIEWTDYSVSPIKARSENMVRPGHACVKISDGCKNCYAETLNKRFGTRQPYSVQGIAKVEHFLDEKALAKMLSFKPRGPFKNGRTRPAVFVEDMADLFGEWVSDEMLDRVFAVFALRSDVDWLCLTKRPRRMKEYRASFDATWEPTRFLDALRLPRLLRKTDNIHDGIGYLYAGRDAGLPNVWLGVSVENQKAADERIPLLLDTPAAVRFLSVEPLLEAVDMYAFLRGEERDKCLQILGHGAPAAPGVDWVIVGGESGPKARPLTVEWVRSVIRQCAAADTACFVKQLGSIPLVTACRQAHWEWGGEIGREAKFRAMDPLHPSSGSWRVILKDRKGGDMSEWPEDLRVRQMPGGAA